MTYANLFANESRASSDFSAVVFTKRIVYRCADSNTRWAGSGYHIVIYDQDTDNSHDVLSEGYLRSI